ncbi:MAG: arginine--tRNA ligase [Candidatus Woesearchaeota archaeon]
MFDDKLASLIAKKFGLDKDEVKDLLEVPPNPSLGDFAFPCFSLAKKLKKSPAQIASENTDINASFLKEVKAVGPYLNFFLNNFSVSLKLKDLGFDFKQSFETILIESPSPNTNKPLHLGHVRNMLLGVSTANIFKKLGNNVLLTEVVNDKGTHICKSMLAYKLYGEGETPKSSGIKGDFFAGKYYVLFNEKLKENPELEQKAQQMLVDWENGDTEVLKLWDKMREWCLDGFRESYKDFGMKIDVAYFESDLYLEGKKIVEQGLAQNKFKKEEDGAIYVDLEHKGLGKKYLQRKDGTSIYITQDIYLAKKRFNEFKMDKMVYVVASEQDYHFKVLFEIFNILEYEFAQKCHHLSYGMVHLPEGRMKSREGNVVDADKFRLELIEDAKSELKERYSLDESELNRRAEIIGMGALKFFILKHDSKKDMTYNPKESLSFSGETGPYIQYTYARICSIFKKSSSKPSLSDNLAHDLEKQLTFKLFDFEGVILKSAQDYKPSLICNYLLELSQLTTKYYHEVQIISDDKELEQSRLFLLDKVRVTLKEGLAILGIDVLYEM